MKAFKLKKLSVAVALLAGAGSAQALTPWADGAPPAATTYYISGGAAQDQAFGEVIQSLAAANTLDVFGDSKTATTTAGSVADFGSRWTVYYFTGGANAPTALQGAKIAVVKRSLGAAGYGVIPLFQNGATNNDPAGQIEELDIGQFNVTDTAHVTTQPAPANLAGVPHWRLVLDSANINSTTLPLKNSHGGVLGVDAKLLLKAGVNYPTVVARVNTASGTDAFLGTWNAIPSYIKQLSTGGLAYGIGVTTDLYKVLQNAQRLAGTLPNNTGTQNGDYSTEQNIPTLGRNFVASLLSGKISTWDQVKIADVLTTPGTPVARPLTDPVVTGGVLPQANPAGKIPVAVATRNPGAAIGAVAYSTFLNYPWTTGSFSPPLSETNAAFEATSTPILKQPGGANATGQLLDDWNQGANTSGKNNTAGPTAGTFAKRWGIAVNSADRNSSGTLGVDPEAAGKQHWRYVRIDGYLPTLENIAAGAYPHWAEGVLLFNSTPAVLDNTNGVATTATTELLTKIANGLASPTVAASVDNSLIQTWGKTGIFALTKGAEGNTVYTTTIPFDYTNPVVAYTYNSGSSQDEIVPTVVNAGPTVAAPNSGIQLK